MQKRKDSAARLCHAVQRLELLERRELLSVSVDSSGWTAVTPASDTRIVYVSSSAGNDSNSGLAENLPVKTLAKARTLVRNNSADWLLLKRGDTFRESLLQWDKSGRDAQNPILISAYGTGNSRPVLATGTSNGFTTGGTSVNNLYVIGLHFNSSSRNPDSPDYVGTDGGSYGVQMLSKSNNVTFEDSVFDAYKNNISIQAYYGPSTNIALRRCLVLDAYSTTGRSQGAYFEGVSGLTLYQNLFDHNGWDERVNAWASTENHNVYVHSSTTGLNFTENISANASSHGLQARPGGIVKDNLFLANPIGMSFGLVNGSTVKAGGVEGEVSGNVFIGSRAIGSQGRGWGLEIGNTKVGGNTVVRNNIFAHDTQNLFPAIMLSMGFNGDNAQNAVGLNNLIVEDNIVYRWYQGISTNKDFWTGGTGQYALNDLIVRNNDFQMLADTRIVLQNHTFNPNEESWSGNTYWDDAPASGWFSQRNVLKSFDQWKQNVEPTAASVRQEYSDPERTVATFNASQGGAATNEAFISGARARSATSWPDRYAARAVVNYVQNGFAIDSALPEASLDAADVTSRGGKTHTFKVVYTDDRGIKASTIGNGDVRVTGPKGFEQNASLVNYTASGTGGVATYQINAPGGSWDLNDDGVYTVTVRTGEVTDTAGNAVSPGVIGSFRSRTDRNAPTASASASNATSSGGKTHRVTVVYTDNGQIDVRTLDGDDVRIKGPKNFDVPAKLISVNSTSDGSPRTAVYEFVPPGGSWDSGDAGSYKIAINGNEVADTSGNFLPAGTYGKFSALPTPSGPRPRVLAPSAPAAEEPTQAPTEAPGAPAPLALFVEEARFVPGNDDKLVVKFSQDVGGDLKLSHFRIQRTKPGIDPLQRSVMRINYSASRREATITFPDLKSNELQDAHWRLTLKTADIKDADGNPLAPSAHGIPGESFVFNFRKR